MHTLRQRVMGTLLAFVIAIAGAVCACAVTVPKPSADAHACCSSQKSAPNRPNHHHSGHTCNHCNGISTGYSTAKSALSAAPDLDTIAFAPIPLPVNGLTTPHIEQASHLFDQPPLASLYALHCALNL